LPLQLLHLLLRSSAHSLCSVLLCSAVCVCQALRLFQDRLVFAEEREWTDRTVDAVAKKHFPQVNHSTALARPVLFSNWLTKNYTSVGQAALRDHVKTRLRVFYEEELSVKLVIFDEVLDHILRIDRVLRQPLGHLLLVGASGAVRRNITRRARHRALEAERELSRSFFFCFCLSPFACE
jgi:hypothetical protein